MLKGLNFFYKSYKLKKGRKKKQMTWAFANKLGMAKCFISLAEALKEVLLKDPMCIPLNSPTYILGNPLSNHTQHDTQGIV